MGFHDLPRVLWSTVTDAETWDRPLGPWLCTMDIPRSYPPVEASTEVEGTVGSKSLALFSALPSSD